MEAGGPDGRGGGDRREWKGARYEQVQWGQEGQMAGDGGMAGARGPDGSCWDGGRRRLAEGQEFQMGARWGKQFTDGEGHCWSDGG